MGKVSVRCDAKEWVSGKKREIVFFKGRVFNDPAVAALMRVSGTVSSIVVKHCYKYGILKESGDFSDNSIVPHFFRIEHVKGLSGKLEDMGRSEFHIELEVSSFNERQQLFDSIKCSPHLSPLIKRHKYGLGALNKMNTSLESVMKRIELCPDISGL